MNYNRRDNSWTNLREMGQMPIPNHFGRELMRIDLPRYRKLRNHRFGQGYVTLGIWSESSNIGNRSRLLLQRVRGGRRHRWVSAMLLFRIDRKPKVLKFLEGLEELADVGIVQLRNIVQARKCLRAEGSRKQLGWGNFVFRRHRVGLRHI